MERYRINILGLSLSVHHFQYEVGKEFFSKYGKNLAPEGSYTVDVTLDKHETFLDTFFSIQGSARLICDRSLDAFDYPVKVSSKIIFKYGEEDKEISEDVVMIRQGTESLDLGQFIYEFIALAIPMKKLHPRFEDEAESVDTLVYTSEKKEEIDPRWEILKKLNKN